MGALAEEMLEVLNCETVFVIPILGGIEVMESVVATWIAVIMQQQLKCLNQQLKKLSRYPEGTKIIYQDAEIAATHMKNWEIRKKQNNICECQ